MRNSLIKFLVCCNLTLAEQTANAMDLPESPIKSSDENSQNQNLSTENPTENLKSESDMILELAEGIVDKIVCDYEEILESPSLEKVSWEDLTAKCVLSVIKEDKSGSISIFLESFKDLSPEEIKDAYTYKTLIFTSNEIRKIDPMNQDYMENFVRKHQLKLEVFLGKINLLRQNEFRDYFSNKCQEYAPYVFARMLEIAFKGSMNTSEDPGTPEGSKD